MGVRLDLLHRVTDDELLRLSQRNPEWQFERSAEGDLVMSPAGGESGYRSGQVYLQLELWNRQHGFGITFDSSTGFNLPDGSCLSPDAAWVHRDRWHALTREQRRRYLPFAPDAVFEVRSESDRLGELRAKMEAYVANGTTLAVLVDPETRVVEVYRPHQAPQRFDGAAPLPLDPELSGFSLDVQSLFAEP
jgi:Uma2 family endonuclease